MKVSANPNKIFYQNICNDPPTLCVLSTYEKVIGSLKWIHGSQWTKQRPSNFTGQKKLFFFYFTSKNITFYIFTSEI